MKILVLFFTFALSLNPAFSQSPPAAPAAGKTQLIAHFHALRRNFGNANTAKVEMLSGPEAVKMLRGQSPGKAWQARLGGSKFKITIEDKLDMKLEEAFERLQRLPAEYRRALEVVSEDKKDGVAFYADLDGAAAHGSQNYLNLVKGAGVEVISHEAGHVLEQRATRADPTVLERWNKARTEDGVSISAYGDRVNHEDLAEFAMLYAICLDAGKERLAEDRGGYRVLVPGKPEESELIARILHADPDERMPPAEFAEKKPLQPQQVETLKRWIAEGAKFEKHWAFATPVKRAVPEPGGWGHNEIDRFVHARMKAAGMQPQTAASKEKIMRRVSFDLTGLPPTLAEVESFLRDESGDAYGKVVDRLLESPRFGERWAVWDATRSVMWTAGFMNSTTLGAC